MERSDIFINEFDLSKEDIYQSPFYELLNLYEIMVNEDIIINLFNNEIIEYIFYLLTDDDWVDVSYLFEQLIYDFENRLIHRSELKLRFLQIFQALKSIKSRSWATYTGYCSQVQFDMSCKSILSIPRSSIRCCETYEEIDELIRDTSLAARKGDALLQCEYSFIKLLNNSNEFITRDEINKKVKYKTLVYKFLKPKYVIDLKGKYLNVKKFYISEEEKNYILEDLDYELKGSEYPIHIKDIFEEFRYTYNDLFIKYHVFTPYALFSLLEYLFGDIYEFKRPYITIKGRQIYNKNVMLEEYLMKNEKIGITDLYAHLRKLKLSNAGLFNIIDSMENKLCFENENNIIHWSTVDISISQIQQIEELIYEEVLLEGTMAITDLKCSFAFPNLNIDWDEWFIYSLIKRYSKRLVIVPSSRQFRLATPIVSTEEYIDDFELDYISEYRSNKKIYKSKAFELEEIELDNIKELLEMEV